MVCTTFYNVITNAEFKQQYNVALDNIIEKKKIREDEWAQPILVSLLAIHHKKKKITTIDGDAGRIRHPRKREKGITNKILFF